MQKKTLTHESKVFEMKSQVKSKWNSPERYQNEWDPRNPTRSL